MAKPKADKRMEQAYAAEDKAHMEMMKKAGVTPGMGKMEEAMKMRDYGRNLGKYLYKPNKKG